MNGVGSEALKPQGAASLGWLNQKPIWNVLVGAKFAAGSKPKIWSMKIENSEVEASPFSSAFKSD